jgi:hypothetical protein
VAVASAFSSSPLPPCAATFCTHVAAARSHNCNVPSRVPTCNALHTCSCVVLLVNHMNAQRHSSVRMHKTKTKKKYRKKYIPLRACRPAERERTVHSRCRACECTRASPCSTLCTATESR